MRISSLSIFNTSLKGIQEQQYRISRLTQQIASEKKYIATKDAPIDTGRAMQLSDQIALRTQYQTNQLKAKNVLDEEGTVLSALEKSITDALGEVMASTVGLDATAREQVAMKLSFYYDQIKSMANARDTMGNYMFAGYQTSTAPFAHDPLFYGAAAPQPTTYNGDAGIHQIEIDNGRMIQTNDNLDTVLQSGTANDLLQTLDALATGIRDGTFTQADIDNARGALVSAQDNMRTMIGSLSGRLAAVEDAQDTNTSLLAMQRGALGDIEDVDTAAAIVELKLRQISLEAAENAFSLTSQQSLFNYL